ncbi:MAG TPA: FMN-binding negative transcriptional regulator, partial [Herpetosiphonaceae bacterium]
MYVPAAYQEDDLATLVAFMQANSFATLVSVIDGAPFASHVPLVVGAAGETVTISGHLAKANPQAEALAAGEALAIFTGPHAYVSPANYDRRENVPTWNYIAVHATGRPRLIRHADEPALLAALVEAMIAAYEP